MLSKEKKKQILEKIEKFKGQFDLDESTKISFMDEDITIGQIDRLKSGVVPFDILTGGGWAKGRINEVYGPAGVGKTTLMLNTIGHNQKISDFLATYLNNERTLDRARAEDLGVKLSELVVGEFKTNEQAADFCNSITDEDSGVDCAAFDTIQALSSEGELVKKDKDKSVSDNTMALLPRVWSQFLRMYTSKSIGKMTLILGSQVRMNLGSFIVKEMPTGGNAIKHYNMLNVELSKAGAKYWPETEIPFKSFPVRMKIIKSKLFNRYEGNEIIGYFYKGSFDRKFNIIAMGKDYDVHNNKSYSYIPKKKDKDESKKVTETFKGLSDMYERITEEALIAMERDICIEYEKTITLTKGSKDASDKKAAV